MIRIRVGGLVHCLYWNTETDPIGYQAPREGPIMYKYSPCISTPVFPGDIHPTDASVTCFWCAIRGF